MEVLGKIVVENYAVFSEYLDREVLIDVYLPCHIHQPSDISLLFINDGQDLPKMPFGAMLDGLLAQHSISPVCAIAMHCNADRILEYGTAEVLDYLNRGARAKFHKKFLIKELLPWIKKKFHLPKVKDIGYAGFSLGGLSALDVAWSCPDIFSTVGAFSGSFWWRTVDINNGYVEETDRIIHQLIRGGKFNSDMRFFFQTGNLDETMDRNNNGIIDSIDDTLSLIEALEGLGYAQEKHIKYLELADGRHDVPTWARAFPAFLQWAWPGSGYSVGKQKI